jgi:hypothetical protein
MTVFQPCLQRQTYKGKNEMGGTYFMEKTMLRRVMVGLTILVIALGVANVVRANVSSKGSCSFKSSVSAAEISE